MSLYRTPQWNKRVPPTLCAAGEEGKTNLRSSRPQAAVSPIAFFGSAENPFPSENRLDFRDEQTS
jgi:hypothetical protein